MAPQANPQKSSMGCHEQKESGARATIQCCVTKGTLAYTTQLIPPASPGVYQRDTISFACNVFDEIPAARAFHAAVDPPIYAVLRI